MKIPIIKKIVEEHKVAELIQAEIDLLEGNKPAIEIEGADEGEQLTHVMAAIFIANDMADKNIDFKEALRIYTKRVRESIS